jgi:hypothetical protein
VGPFAIANDFKGDTIESQFNLSELSNLSNCYYRFEPFFTHHPPLFQIFSTKARFLFFKMQQQKHESEIHFQKLLNLDSHDKRQEAILKNILNLNENRIQSNPETNISKLQATPNPSLTLFQVIDHENNDDDKDDKVSDGDLSVVEDE